MAIFHLEAKIIGGKTSKMDATHACSYRHRLKIEGGRDYSRKGGLIDSFFLIPEKFRLSHLNIKPIMFWRKTDEFETAKRKDSQKARELQISLHKELSLEENKQLLTEFLEEQCISLGMFADVVIHQPPENPDNIHAHVMLSLREIELNNDEIVFGKKVRSWNDRKLLLQWRENWEQKSNQILSQKGINTITSKSYVTLYEEAKINNDLKNMELYSTLMKYRTHFSTKDFYKNKNVVISIREEKYSVADSICQKYELPIQYNIGLKNHEEYFARHSNIKGNKDRRRQSPITRIRSLIKNTIYRIRYRIRSLSFGIQLFRQIGISERIREADYRGWTRSRFARLARSNKKNIYRNAKHSQKDSKAFTEWLNSLTMNLEGHMNYEQHEKQYSKSKSGYRYRN